MMLALPTVMKLSDLLWHSSSDQQPPQSRNLPGGHAIGQWSRAKRTHAEAGQGRARAES